MAGIFSKVHFFLNDRAPMPRLRLHSGSLSLAEWSLVAGSAIQRDACDHAALALVGIYSSLMLVSRNPTLAEFKASRQTSWLAGVADWIRGDGVLDSAKCAFHAIRMAGSTKVYDSIMTAIVRNTKSVAH